MEVRQAQEIMTDEDMAGTMIDYHLNPYSPAKYPVPCKKRGKRKYEKSIKKEPAKNKSKQTVKDNEGESQRKITDWLISSSRNGRKLTFKETVEICEFYKNGTLKKKRTSQTIAESAERRESPFYCKRRRQNANRRMKYISRKNRNPDKERYIHGKETLRRMNSL